ncbi:MAG: tRNA (adenosine(37)-N6)-threonylcarbamoyltransferase complex dimerization subunit type 1 TsaB [Gemmatimonadota bacterium]|nr:tRNA (adenosine(37)-N6)-threonylcarbamoyltransferase complex dimerization subunit type 1 TsaB [Gemmatimonadota bacterium]
MKTAGNCWSPQGVYLALDTSTRIGSVCLAVGTSVQDRGVLDKPAAHGSDLLPMIREILKRAGMEPSDLAGIIVGSGPGSFTGVRVAAATAKGMCRSLGIPLWAVSSLEAGAVSLDVQGPTLSEHPSNVLSSEEMARPRYVLFDARSDRVYAACYVPVEHGLEELIPPHATTIGEILADDIPACSFIGDGAERHSDEIQGAGFSVLSAPIGMPSAEGLLALIGRSPSRPPLGDIGLWEPDYIRPSSAERLARSRR